MAEDFSRRDFLKMMAAAGLYCAMPIEAMTAALPQYRLSDTISRGIGKGRTTHQAGIRIIGSHPQDVEMALRTLIETAKKWPSGGKLIYNTQPFDYDLSTGVALARIV